MLSKNMEKKSIFSIEPSQPLKFTVKKGEKMLNIKYNKLVKKIEENGGIVMEYDENSMNSCIVLADEKDETVNIDMPVNTFSKRFVDSCLKNGKLVGLKRFRLCTVSQEKENRRSLEKPVYCHDCPDFDLLSMTKCRHRQETRTFEEELDRAENVLGLTK